MSWEQITQTQKEYLSTRVRFFRQILELSGRSTTSVKGERSWRAGRNNSINKKGAERGHQS